MKAKKKPIDIFKPADLGVDVSPRLKTLKVCELSRRSADIKVPDVATLMAKLRNEAKVCNTLGIQAPNLVGMVNALEKRELVKRLPHPNDGRAMGLHLTESGEILMRDAEKTATNLEVKMTSRMSGDERKTLMLLLKRIYKST